MGDFHEGLAAVGIAKPGSIDSYPRKYGYIDRQGKLIVPLKFDRAGDFYQGRALAELSHGQKQGYIK